MESDRAYFGYYDPKTRSKLMEWRGPVEGWVDITPNQSDQLGQIVLAQERVDRLRAQLRALGVEPNV